MSACAVTPFVSAEDFKDARLHASWTVANAAACLGVTRRTIRNWESGKRRVPYSAFELVRILGCHYLPGEPWQGFRIVRDTLYSPEGHAFKAADLGWWGLTCAIARYWLDSRRSNPGPLPVDLWRGLFALRSHGRAAQAVGEGNPQWAEAPEGARPLQGDADSPAQLQASALPQGWAFPAEGGAVRDPSNNPHKVQWLDIGKSSQEAVNA